MQKQKINMLQFWTHHLAVLPNRCPAPWPTTPPCPPCRCCDPRMAPPPHCLLPPTHRRPPPHLPMFRLYAARRQALPALISPATSLVCLHKSPPHLNLLARTPRR